MSEREWYFVRRLDPHERPDQTARVEIQVLDEDGLGTAIGYIGDSDTQLVIEGKVIPAAVLETAKRRRTGGEYVNAEGIVISPF